MTVQVQSPGAFYTGNGIATIYAYPFRILDAADLQVIVDGITLVLEADYTVDGVEANLGGNVTFLVPPANGVPISIKRIMELIQPVDYLPYDKFPAEIHERALDRLTMLLQNMIFNAERSILMESGPSLKTSQMPLAGPITMSDFMPIIQGGANRQLSILGLLAKSMITVFGLEDSLSQGMAITAGANKMIWDGFPGGYLLDIWGGLRDPSSAGNVVVDLNVNGTSLMNTHKLLFVPGQTQTGLGGAQPPVLTSNLIGHKARLSMDYDLAGANAKGLIIYVACIVNPDFYPLPS